MSDKWDEFRLQGVPISEGIAIGHPFFMQEIEEAIPEFPISLGEVDDEIERYRRALLFSREDLKRLQLDLEGSGTEEAATIIDAHIQMLEDPMMTTEMEEKIRQMLQNTESVLDLAIRDYGNRISQVTNPFFQQRMTDVMDLANRILGHLSPKGKISVTDAPENSIIFTRELTPSYSAAARTSQVSAFVSHRGGGNSHAALIARAKGIPYVSCVDIEVLKQRPCHQVIVDGETGEIILNPTPETLRKYQLRKTLLKTHFQSLKRETHYETETADGCPIGVHVNFGCLSEIDALAEVQADGVGLLRTEYLFFENPEFISSEEVQMAAYRKIIDRVGGAPVVMRVFDIGGDKIPEGKRSEMIEENPVLGCRGIRYLLRNPSIFKMQLSALLQVAVDGDVRILLPLVSDVRELIQSRQLLLEVVESLQAKGIPHRANVQLGCMIEVPSAVLVCDALAEYCDFMAIGTNDLVQYTLGIDRGNPLMQEMLYPAHPSVIRMIKMVVTECRRFNRPVSICGEMASNPLFVPLLLGLGVTDFSCSLRYVLLVKQAIRKNSLLDVSDLAQHILQLNSAAEISQVLIDWNFRYAEP